MVEKLIEMGSTLVLLDTETETTRIIEHGSVGRLPTSAFDGSPDAPEYLIVKYDACHIVRVFNGHDVSWLNRRLWPFIEWDKPESGVMCES